ncbi:EXD2 [Symbiodinium necroappetens]|uniref:EXD2 protein n=1 Tax=Symbiodinium necroappetens TaxID=1628268 RepID=A0A812W122_9DINO|nr:EXD2 [Symbiodinium necroappetens]
MASMEFEVSWNGATEKVAVLTSSSAAEQSAKDISETSETTIVGFDTEWGSKGEVALVQLATADRCLLLLLPEVHLQDCPSLLRLFEDPHYLKVGVAVGLDAELLKEQFQIDLRGCVDLARLAAREGEVRQTQPIGLAALTQQLLGVDLPKDASIRCSNWAERPLSPDQLAYAARDALAGRDCAAALASKHKPPDAHLLDWCQGLLDKAGKDPKPGKVKKAVAEDPSAGADAGRLKATLDCGAYSCVTKFGMRTILGSDGKPLMHMKDRTVDGLVRRGMASISKEGGVEVVRLNFTPTDHYEYAGLDAAERNACVGCGSYGVARYYIVPKVFFSHLPEACKSYNCHDVVMLCPRCRAIAEPAQMSLTQELLAAHGALRAGSLYANENALTQAQITAKKAAITLRKGGTKPFLPNKVQALREAVAAGLGMAVEDLGEETRAFDAEPDSSEEIMATRAEEEARKKSERQERGRWWPPSPDRLKLWLRAGASFMHCDESRLQPGEFGGSGPGRAETTAMSIKGF